MKLRLPITLMVAVLTAISSLHAADLSRTVSGNTGNWTDADAWGGTTWNLADTNNAVLTASGDNAVLNISDGDTVNADKITLNAGTDLTISGGTINLNNAGTPNVSSGNNIRVTTNRTLTILSDITATYLTVGSGGDTALSGTVKFGGQVEAGAQYIQRLGSGVFMSGSSLNAVRVGIADRAGNTMTIEDGATVTVTGNSNGADRTAATITNTNNLNSDVGGETSSFYMGHWNGKGLLNMTGGTLTSSDANLILKAKQGYGVVVMTGSSVMNIHGIDFRLKANASGTNANEAGVFIGANENKTDNPGSTAVLNLGADGLIGMNDKDNGRLYLGTATLGTDNSSWTTISHADNGNVAAITLLSETGTVFRPDAAYSITLNHPLAGAGKLVLNGDGTLVLNGIGQHTGGTVVKKGTLSIQSTDSIGSSLMLERGAAILKGNESTFEFGVNSGGPSLTISGGSAASDTATINGNLAMNGGLFTLDTSALALSGTTAFMTVTGNLAFTGTTDFSLVGQLSEIALGEYLLASVDGTVSGFTDTSFNYLYSISGSASTYVYSIRQQDNNFYLNVASAAALLWNVEAGGAWDTTSSNWLTEGTSTSTTYADGSIVKFGDLGPTANDIGVTVAGQVAPSYIGFLNNTDTYTLSGAGSLSGGGQIEVIGTGTVNLNLDNSSYNGVINLSSGILNAQTATALGTGRVHFSGGVLGLETDTNLAEVGGDSDAKILVGSGKNVTLTASEGAETFYTKNIVKPAPARLL